ncbi:hypothetical protein [Desulfonema magnum]|uniref:Uncharacterized protein n=1 Tax=Desulfonema magnum TaxID=45655 RepID=A0A975BN98_9BACT|nr:hypothetical protein [Desulfonema magnum]QTA88628.1 Uncharacterized protein dnm_046750 [Desulfonema magnum]
MQKDLKSELSRPNRTISLPFEQNSYSRIVEDAFQFRLFVDEMVAKGRLNCFPPKSSKNIR